VILGSEDRTLCYNEDADADETLTLNPISTVVSHMRSANPGCGKKLRLDFFGSFLNHCLELQSEI